jgi:transcriptional regulator with XRE-family HTH domain
VEFGGRLRQVREDARLTGRALAGRLGWAGSKVSRIEHGRQIPTVGDVTAWAGAVEASEDLLADLLADLRAVRLEYRTWKRQLRRGNAARQRAITTLETRTALIRAYDPVVVPGLLQTADYARHVLRNNAAVHNTPGDIEDGVGARLHRQQALYDGAKRFRFLLSESALRNMPCPPAALRGQLDRLAAVSGLETVELAVLPFTVRLPYSANHQFWIFDDSLVLVEGISAELAIRDGEDIELYERVFDLLWDRALTGQHASGFCSAVAEQLTT